MSRRGGADGPASVPVPVRTMSELVASRRNELRLSYRDMVELAAEAGYRLTEPAFQGLVNKPLTNFPNTSTMQALSIVLQVPVQVVVDAASHSVGLYGETDAARRAALVFAEKTKGMTATQIEQLLEFMDSAVRVVKQAGST